MAGDDARYEFMSVWAIRGAEAKTTAKWHSEGWELVSQSQAPLRTKMTFRRAKPTEQKWALRASVGALIVIGIIVGVMAFLERDGGGTAAPTSSPTEMAVVPSGQATEHPSEEPRKTNWNGDQLEFRFGETAHFTATAGSGPSTPLTFTVTAPTAFTPSDPADATQAATVFFTVTITNLSDTETWDDSFLLSYVTSGGIDGDHVFSTGDGMAGPGGGPDVIPGQSVVAKDGWSVANADDVVYELDIDGLAGYSIFFTK